LLTNAKRCHAFFNGQIAQFILARSDDAARGFVSGQIPDQFDTEAMSAGLPGNIAGAAGFKFSMKHGGRNQSAAQRQWVFSLPKRLRIPLRRDEIPPGRPDRIGGNTPHKNPAGRIATSEHPAAAGERSPGEALRPLLYASPAERSGSPFLSLLSLRLAAW
jgi:hypothetical protein